MLVRLYPPAGLPKRLSATSGAFCVAESPFESLRFQWSFLAFSCTANRAQCISPAQPTYLLTRFPRPFHLFLGGISMDSSCAGTVKVYRQPVLNSVARTPPLVSGP